MQKTTNEEKQKREKIQYTISTILAFITLGNILLSVFNYGVTSKLQPLASNIQMNAQAIEENKKEINNNSAQIQKLYDYINTSIDKVNGKLDYIINLHIK